MKITINGLEHDVESGITPALLKARGMVLPDDEVWQQRGSGDRFLEEHHAITQFRRGEDEHTAAAMGRKVHLVTRPAGTRIATSNPSSQPALAPTG